jgi:hypothetical protein
MPISSSEIAQLNGAYQQQYSQQAQFAAQMSQGNIYGGGGPMMGGSMGSGMQGDQLMSRGMNRAAGIGVPLAAAGMSLMGLDPFSIGLKAGGLASASGMGMAGAIGVGAGVALPLMAGMGAAKYAGSQMMEGASQQSNLNQTLRSSFNFRNSAGGQGFQRADMTEIGSMVRDMSGQFGPGGEITGFKELTSLAGKMGTMGFAQGVRDVKEFSAKFKEMVTTLKGMAKDLGTTLEGAMEFAQAAKGSGVFGMGNMAKFTGSVRGSAVAGGLAVSEVTGAASIGSQIARSIGGLGKQGAGAGIRTIGQIGTAQQMGVLSEEDIYNVTGLTGAEGRQAYAASSMQKAGSFLQSGRGRRTLAAIAGKNGTLDEEGVQELLAGGMDIGETMRRDNKMKTTVGRANFIRNEGRLRGAALERIGGFLPALQLKEWAESKGVDINNMDDRSMLFAQRQLGMGRDEVDQAVKMANALPQIARRMQASQQDDSYLQKIAQEHKQQGIEGVEQRFKQAQERINGKMQEAGQNLFNSGSEALDRWINKMTGTYEHVMTEKADNAFRNMKWGGNDREVALTMGGGASPFGSGDPAKQASMSTRDFFGGSGEKLRQAMGYTEGSLIYGKTMAQKYKEAGYNIKEGSQADLQKSLLEASQTAEGAQRLNDKLGEADGDLTATLRREYVGKMAGLSGQARVEAVKNVLEEQAKAGNKSAQNMLANFGKGAGEQAASVNTLEQQLGISDKSLLSANSATPEGGTGGGGFAPGQREKDFADKLYGSQNQTLGRTLGGVAGGVLGMGMPVAAMAGAWLGGKLQSSISGDDAKRGAFGKYMTSDEAQSRAFDLFGGSGKKAAIDTQIKMQNELMDLQQSHQETSGRATGIATQLAAQEYMKLKGKYPDGKIPEEELKKLTDTYGSYGIDTKEKLDAAYNVTLEAARSQNSEVNREEALRVRTRAKGEQKKMKDLGLTEIDPKTGKSKLVEGLSKEGAAAVEIMQQSLGLEASYSGTEQERRGIGEKQRMGIEALANLSEKERAKIATNAAGTELGSTMATINADEKRIARGLKRGNLTQTALGGLGLSLSKEDMKTMNLKDESSQKRLEAFMLEQLGGKDISEGAKEALQSKIHRLTGAIKGKNVAEGALAYESIQGDQAVQDQQKKKQDEQEDQNPAVREAKKQTSILEKMLKFQGMTASEISELNDKAQAGSAEDTGGGGGSFHNAPNKGRTP